MALQPPRHELTECDREPIHEIGAVQPFGGLIALNADWVIAHRSANCGAILGLQANPEAGKKLSDIFTGHAVETLQTGLSRIGGDDAVERLFGMRLTWGGPLFDVAIHPSRGSIIVEFERHAVSEFADHLSLIGPVLSQLEPVRDEAKLCRKAAGLVREMLGYDRVMVYKFHRDESGEVVAEDRREDIEPFLGLRYPRADIPQQARELFRRNKFRIIADMQAEPVPIEPAQSIGGEPLDLSMSGLRAMSPVHVQYMKNMGVEASLSIALVRHNKLWGLISCHHYEPRLPPFSLRTVAEMFSQMFSLMLDRILIDRSEQQRAKGRELHDKLMRQLAGGTSLADSLPMLDDVLQDVIAHDGASVLIDGRYSSRGDAPSEGQFTAISDALGAAPISTIIATPSLAQQVPAAAEFDEIAAGAMILPISRSPRDYLVLWRKPLSQQVKWAGDPGKAVSTPGERLEPRGSFAAWVESVEGASEEWSDEEIQVAEGLRVTLLEVILRMSDEAAEERARSQEQQELLIAELNHRVRNILNLIRSLVSQSQGDAMDVGDFARIIGGRISALASAHDNITRQNWSPAPISALFETELAAYIADRRDRFRLTGPDVLVKPEAYTVLALVVHEMVTNSAKYGSLCDSSGVLTVDLAFNRLGDLEIGWRESGGPPVQAPTRRGFGSTIIERSIPHELKGDVDLRYKLSGLEADFLLPARYILREKGSAAKPQPIAEHAKPNAATIPDHVLVVEDSIIIALDTEESLRTLGVRQIDVEGSVAGALKAIAAKQPDLAIIDFNLGSESSAPVAEELKKRGVRFVLATGYAEMDDVLEKLGAEALLKKPYGRDEIAALLNG